MLILGINFEFLCQQINEAGVAQLVSASDFYKKKSECCEFESRRWRWFLITGAKPRYFSYYDLAEPFRTNSTKQPIVLAKSVTFSHHRFFFNPRPSLGL